MSESSSSCRSRPWRATPEDDGSLGATDGHHAQHTEHEKNRRKLLCRAVLAPCPAFPMIFIWLLVALNYAAHMVFRAAWWHGAIVVTGHLILVLQVVSFARAAHTHPGTPPPDWEARARSVIRDGVHVPPRAYFVRRMGTIVLGFDHHCFWLGRAIGWRNRKFFIVFVLWSAVLAGFACVLTAVDICEAVPAMAVFDPETDLDPETLTKLRRLSSSAPTPATLFALAVSQLKSREIARVGLLFALTVLDLVSFVLLGSFGVWHVCMALRNRTSLQPVDELIYDVGRAENWRQVMGTRWWLWALPVYGDDEGPFPADGMTWPCRGDDHAGALEEAEA